MKKKSEMHPIKQVSKQLGLTYRELGEAIGYSESTLRKSVSKNEISPQLKKALELYLENISLKTIRKKIENTKKTLGELLEQNIKEKEVLETFLNAKIREL